MVPVAIVGMRELLPMESIHIRSGKVMVKVGQPIATRGLKLSDREALTQKLYDEIRSMLDDGGGARLT